MDWSAIALTGILVLVILTLPLCPSWFMVIPVLIGMIAFSCDRRRRSTEDQGLPLYIRPPARDDQSPAGDASRPAGDDQSPASDASRRAGDDQPSAPAPDPAGDDQPLAPAPDPAGGASPPPGPLPAGSAPPSAVDALVPSGKKRSEPESSSTQSSSSGFEHDVFLSFRGPDTCKGFTGHLYSKLADAGIRVFMDDEELSRREEIWSKLKEAIKRSRISIAILSINYASSKQCLDELVQIWECRESNGQIIIPIFYKVSSSDVIHQAGDFGRSFNLHEMDRVDSTIIETWRDVLRQIGKLSGYDLDNRNMPESELVKRVVKRVVQELRKDDQVVTDRLVGIDHHVDEIMRKLGVAHSEGQAVEVRGEEVRVVGIWGEPGVGKTTLAKVVFNKTRKLFDAYSFLEDIRREGVQFSRHMLIADLQKQKPEPLESSGEAIASSCPTVKVLIVLDNVDKDEQIKELVGEFTSFGPGSRIIVTTDKRNVLEAFDVGAADRGTVEVHEVGPMSDENALELFYRHAYGVTAEDVSEWAAAEDVSEYNSLSRGIVEAIGGLPSEIVHHASVLRRNVNMDTWKTTLDLLRKKPKK